MIGSDTPDRSLEWEGDVPDLWEQFRYQRKIYVIYTGDGYLIEAHDELSDALTSYEYLRDDPENQELYLHGVIHVPWDIADEVVDQSGIYDSGYEAASKLTKHGQFVDEPIRSFCVFDDVDFEDWSEDLKESHRDMIWRSLTRSTHPAGTLVYHNTSVPGIEEDEDLDDLEFLPVVLDRNTALSEDTEQDLVGKPQHCRLITLRLRKDIPITEVNDMKEVLTVLESDEEDEWVTNALNRLQIYENLQHNGRILLLNPYESGLEIVDIRPIPPAAP